MTPKLEKLIKDLYVCNDISTIETHMLNTHIDANDVANYVSFESEGYTRNRLIKTDWIEVLVLCWKPGQKSKIHNHADSICALKVIEGTLKNTNYILKDEKVRFSSKDELSLSQCAVISGEDNFHEIANDYPNNAISIHFYTPPIEHYKETTLQTEYKSIVEDVL